MDHSVQAYLQRLSTKELEGALQHYLRGDHIEDHYDAIRAILNELHKRYEPMEPTPRELELYERMLQKRKEVYHL